MTDTVRWSMTDTVWWSMTVIFEKGRGRKKEGEREREREKEKARKRKGEREWPTICARATKLAQATTCTLHRILALAGGVSLG